MLQWIQGISSIAGVALSIRAQQLHEDQIKDSARAQREANTERREYERVQRDNNSQTSLKKQSEVVYAELKKYLSSGDFVTAIHYADQVAAKTIQGGLSAASEMRLDIDVQKFLFEVYVTKAVALMALSSYYAAIHILKHCQQLRDCPRSAEYYLLLGLCYLEVKQFEQAEACFQTTREMAPAAYPEIVLLSDYIRNRLNRLIQCYQDIFLVPIIIEGRPYPAWGRKKEGGDDAGKNLAFERLYLTYYVDAVIRVYASPGEERRTQREEIKKFRALESVISLGRYAVERLHLTPSETVMFLSKQEKAFRALTSFFSPVREDTAGAAAGDGVAETKGAAGDAAVEVIMLYLGEKDHFSVNRAGLEAEAQKRREWILRIDPLFSTLPDTPTVDNYLEIGRRYMTPREADEHRADAHFTQVYFQNALLASTSPAAREPSLQTRVLLGEAGHRESAFLALNEASETTRFQMLYAVCAAPSSPFKVAAALILLGKIRDLDESLPYARIAATGHFATALCALHAATSDDAERIRLGKVITNVSGLNTEEKELLSAHLPLGNGETAAVLLTRAQRATVLCDTTFALSRRYQRTHSEHDQRDFQIFRDNAIECGSFLAKGLLPTATRRQRLTVQCFLDNSGARRSFRDLWDLAAAQHSMESRRALYYNLATDSHWDPVDSAKAALACLENREHYDSVPDLQLLEYALKNGDDETKRRVLQRQQEKLDVKPREEPDDLAAFGGSAGSLALTGFSLMLTSPLAIAGPLIGTVVLFGSIGYSIASKDMAYESSLENFARCPGGC